MTQNTRQSVLFPSLFSKPVLATFDQPDSSFDGGALLLKGIDSQMNLSERLTACIEDARRQGKVLHSIHDLLRRRIYGIACGHADCNDAARLADDPVQKLLLDRAPIKGDALGSQPTLCRFENAPSKSVHTYCAQPVPILAEILE